ncbi:MAG: alpha-L-fucosidase [Gloeobacteraceae cyanobacterium ES-bin-144]|nr:alpha-L-fucosidase [Verrucomicrobiales bacterium]
MNRRHFLSRSGAAAASLPFAPQLIAAEAPVPAAAAPPPLAPRFGDARDWWFQNRFGMFVHWGLYSIEGWHEQDQWRRAIPREEYGKLKQRWNPDKFDPDALIDAALTAEMSYLCFTTKHHDGFCLFETKHTDFNSINSPAKKDFVRILADACHRRNFPLCLYYSIADWHHPNYPNQGRHHELPPQPGDDPSLPKYLEFLKAQVRELCTNYGEIHGFWWDMNVEKHVDPSINKLIRKLQPKAVINNRGFDEGDFGTPERDYKKEETIVLSFEKRTEACQSIGMESWSWRANEDYYSDRHIFSSIARFRSRDANYLLNVGPLPDGSLPIQAVEYLKRTGAWYRLVREAFDGTVPASHLTENRDVFLTRKGNDLYALLYASPKGEAVKLNPLALLPRRATLLNTGTAIPCSIDLVPSEHGDKGRYLRLTKLPVNEHANTVLVVKLEFDDLPQVIAPAKNSGISNF